MAVHENRDFEVIHETPENKGVNNEIKKKRTKSSLKNRLRMSKIDQNGLNAPKNSFKSLKNQHTFDERRNRDAGYHF